MDKQLFLDIYFIVLSRYKTGKEVSSTSAVIQKSHLRYEHDCKTLVIKTIESENKKCEDVFISIHLKTMSSELSVGLCILSISKYLMHLR